MRACRRAEVAEVVVHRPIDNPPNPWRSVDVDYLPGEDPEARIEIYEDHTREILSHNDSPDIGFRWSLNPYRGCQHACAYCYARPTHEYLSLGAGTDFETKLHVKLRAPELLRSAFARPSWTGETVVFSGVTDCYQPIEATYQLTRRCLEVCAEHRNPVGVVTKAPLIERDIDVLQQLARDARLGVTISIPFIDDKKARAVEPWVATPARRLRTVETLAKAGIPVGVLVAPIIPGLSDEDMPKVLEAAAQAGAQHAAYVLLRLPGSVKPVFEARIRAAFPDRADKILARVRDTRGGELYRPQFGRRFVGQGEVADAIATLFTLSAKKHGLWRIGMGNDERVRVRDVHRNDKAPGERAHDGSLWSDAPSTFVRPAPTNDDDAATRGRATRQQGKQLPLL